MNSQPFSSNPKIGLKPADVGHVVRALEVRYHHISDLLPSASATRPRRLRGRFSSLSVAA